MAEFITNGMDELLSTLESMSARMGRSIEDKVLRKAAVPVLDDMIANAPVRAVGSMNSKEWLGITTGMKKGKRVFFIGIDKADTSPAFYLKFSEWGTSRQPAKPFIQPALEKNRANIRDIVLEELRRELGL